MTKHLRLIMLSLLAMICLGGYSLPKSVVYTFAKEPTLVSGKNIVSKWNIPTNGNTDNNGRGYGWSKPSKAVTATLSADSKVRVTSIVINANTNGTTTVAIAVGNNAIAAQTIQKSGTKGDTNKNYTYTNTSKEESTDIKFTLKSDKSVWIKTITIYYEESDGRAPTTVKFTGLTGEGVNLIDGKLDGNDFTGYTAKVVGDVAGEIKYTSDNEAVATVGQDGKLTIKDYGKATITATFTPTETEKYAESTDSYTVINNDPNAVVFDANVDKGVKTKSGTSDNIVKADLYSTTLYGSNAAFNAKEGNAYRFYASSHMRISVTKGIITKIKIEGNDQDYPLGNLKLRPEQPGKITSSSDNEVIWEGSANSVRFSNNATKQARVSKITVTVMPHYTFDETVDNVIEAKENAYVTLKRTFYHDNAWNTLCLPFDVDANKVATAFAGAEIREIDPNKCTANTIQFVPATEIKAGVPYIIKWNENVAEAQTFEKTFEGVTLIAEPKPVKVNNDITFTGFYNKTTADKLGESVAAIGAENKLFKVTSGEMKGFRAAFVLNSNAQPSAIKLVIDGTATGIEDLVIDGVKANGRVYNLNGQYVGNSLNGLQPGLYIQNGKKIVVK